MADQVTFQPMTDEAAKHLGTALATIDPWLHYHFSPEALVAYFTAEEDGASRFEILDGGKLAGTICVRTNWLRGPYLQLLAILPQFQNRGIGSRALSWFEGEAKKTRAQNIWVVASEFNKDALAFYRRYGFASVATLDGLVAEGTTEILLRKRLTIS